MSIGSGIVTPSEQEIAEKIIDDNSMIGFY